MILRTFGGRMVSRLRALPVSSGCASTVACMTGADAPSQSVHGIEPLLSLDEVSRLLRISESGIYRLVRSGALPRVKVGNRTLFEPAEIRRFIARGRDEQAQSKGGREMGASDLGVLNG